jgi:outer membrane biogenesis lipoprotein LolB
MIAARISSRSVVAFAHAFLIVGLLLLTGCTLNEAAIQRHDDAQKKSHSVQVTNNVEEVRATVRA